MPGSTRSNTLWLVVVVSVMAMLAGCDNVYQIEKTHDHPTAQTFVEATGHELNFDLYLPNSFTGWEPAPDNKFTYNPQTQSYELTNFDVSRTPVDNLGERFKITSENWQHEYGFTYSNSYIEESTVGLLSGEPAVFNLHQYTIQADAKDMFVEFPANTQPKALHFKVKIIDPRPPVRALLMLSFSE